MLSLSPSVARYSTLSRKQIFHDGWALWKSSVRSPRQEAGSSPGDTCDIRWKLKEELQSVVLLSFSVLRSRCVLATQRPVSHGGTAASSWPPWLSLLLFSLCINATASLVLQRVAASQASLQALSHLHHNPLQPFSSLPSALTFSSPSLSLCLRWSSLLGRRQLAGCELATMETGTLPLPQVSLATSSLAL